MSNRIMQSTKLIIICFFLFPFSALAEAGVGAALLKDSSVIEVSHDNSHASIPELSRQGKHFDVLVQLVQEEYPLSVADQLAAANSSWALGLVDRARALWNDVLANKEFKEDDRYRAALGRSIMELQESNYEEARASSERIADELPFSELRAQFWLVIAEALKEQKALSIAEDYYKRAIKEGDRPARNEARYLLGACQMKLGRYDAARYSLASVEAGSKYTAAALKRLIQIDTGQRNFEGVLTWISEGRASYPDEFKDGTISYAMISALIEIGRIEEAQAELQSYRIRRSDQDSWFSVSEAAVEAKLAKLMLGEDQIEIAIEKLDE